MRIVIVLTAATFLLTSSILAADGAVISGFVRDVSGAGLPGVTIQIRGTPHPDLYTDATGAFRTRPVSPGSYEVAAVLEGLEPETTKLDLADTDASIELVLKPGNVEMMIVLSCGGPDCDDERHPSAPHHQPSCQAMDMNDTLFVALEKGDRSAVSLLQRRFGEEVSQRERVRIAQNLLKDHDRDGSYHRFLTDLAERALAVAPIVDEENNFTFDEDYLKDCAERGTTAEDEWDTLSFAFRAVAADPRSTSLLERGLASRSSEVVAMALGEFAERKDSSVLSNIDELISKLPHKEYALWSLVNFEAEEADAIVKRYVTEERFESMTEWRKTVEYPSE